MAQQRRYATEHHRDVSAQGEHHVPVVSAVAGHRGHVGEVEVAAGVGLAREDGEGRVDQDGVAGDEEHEELDPRVV